RTASGLPGRCTTTGRARPSCMPRVRRLEGVSRALGPAALGFTVCRATCPGAFMDFLSSFDWSSFMTAHFWVAVGQIIMIDILLGGDNAVVIALACRRLPAKQRMKGIIWGTAGAIGLRIILIFFALTLL